MIRHLRRSERQGDAPLVEKNEHGVTIINGAPMYDPNQLKEIAEDYGLDESESWLAVFLASATMDGAYEDINGGIHSLQTACNELGYNEHLIRSKEMDKAEFENIRQTIAFYHDEGITLANSPEKAQKELTAGPRKVAHWLIVLKPDDIDRVMDIMQDKWKAARAKASTKTHASV